MKHEITLKPIEDKDIPLIEEWIHQDYILKWYHEPDEWINEMRERDGKFSFLNHFLVYDGGKPFAFCQYYDCYYAQEDWYTIDTAGHTYSIDYLIGDATCLGKGYGKTIVKALVDKIKKYKDAKSIIVQPENENIPSCKSLEANGFIYDEEKQYYFLNIN